MLSGFKSGELDYIQEAPQAELPNLIASGDMKIVDYLGTYYVCFQTQKAPFDNPKVREEFRAGSIVIGSDAKFTVMLKPSLLEVVFSASADVLLLSLDALLSLPQPASMEKAKAATNTTDTNLFFIVLSFKSFIDKQVSLCYPISKSLTCKNESRLTGGKSSFSTAPEGGKPPSDPFHTL